MRDNDDDGLILSQDRNGATQSILTIGIQIRVRFIEHDQERIAKDGPREPNALTLPRRQRYPTQAYSGSVSFRQAQNDVVHARNAGSLQDRIGRSSLVETRDVFRYRAVEQRHVLGQVTNMPSQIFVAPLIDGGAVKPYRAMPGGPDSDQRS